MKRSRRGALCVIAAFAAVLFGISALGGSVSAQLDPGPSEPDFPPIVLPPITGPGGGGQGGGAPMTIVLETGFGEIWLIKDNNQMIVVLWKDGDIFVGNCNQKGSGVHSPQHDLVIQPGHDFICDDITHHGKVM